jgi:small subunit ribosomal protein S17
MSEQVEKERAPRQTKVGTVVSAKMDKTVVVQVEKIVMHRLYKRRLRRSSKFQAHDAENECREGDVVTLIASRPLSKTKRWKVSGIVKRARA